MREIKFRAWCEEKKEMLQLQKMSFKTCKCMPYGWNMAYEFTDIMQYTGLKDKNGVEIYEADIVKIIDYMSQEHIVVVKYDAKLLQFIFKTVDGHYSNMDTNEVIGNIYENPELLEG